MMQTGIPACDAVKEMTLTGNVIPQIWYKTIVKRDLKNPKPHLLAINVLADIVYWYRPTEVRDEATGAVIGYRKKFAADLLQRSYAQIAEQFGCSIGQAKDAIVFLEQMGVVRRELRTIEVQGMSYNNILFLALDVDKLRELTYPSAGISPEGCTDSDTPVSEFHQRGIEIPADPVSKFHQYTENTTKTSTEISSEKSICLSDSQADGLTNTQQTEALVKTLRVQGSIPANLSQHPAKIRALVNWLCDAEHYLQNPPERIRITPTQQKSFKLFLDCLCAMACARTAQTYAGETVSAADVLAAISQHAPGFLCGELSDFALAVVSRFCETLEGDGIKNCKGYMKSVIWNCFAEYEINREQF